MLRSNSSKQQMLKSSLKRKAEPEDKKTSFKTSFKSHASLSSNNKIPLNTTSASSYESPLELSQDGAYAFYPHLSSRFKNPNFVSNIGSKKKWKNIKSTLSSLSTNNGSNETLSSFNAGFPNIEAPPSISPKRKYCDVTGLLAYYKDPKTGLRYHSCEVYNFIKRCSTSQVQDFLALRNANTVLK